VSEREDEDLGGGQTLRPMTLLAATGWTFATLLLTVFVVELTDGARPGAITDLVNVTACTVLVYSLLLFAMLRLYAPHTSVRDVLGFRPVSPAACVLSAAAGVTLSPGLDVIGDYLLKRFPRPAEQTDMLDKLMHATSRGERVVLVGALLVGPLCDELFFRGVLFRGLRRTRPEGLAIVATALLYSISSGDPHAVPTAFIVGLFASWLRGRSGSIVPALIAHVAIDSVSLVPLAMGKEDLPLGPRVAVGGAVVAAVCAWGAGMIFARDGRAEEARLQDA
jgi:membrane protease YdiL (CAAX protease family)